MIVISDTGPLNYLLLIEALDVLPQMYGHLFIPAVVQQELRHPDAPTTVKEWAAQLPNWVEVIQPKALLALSLDAGEMAAISLAIELNADLILMDERRGRRAAQAHGLAVAGTLGVLADAARSGLIELPMMLGRLRETRFRISEELIALLMQNL